MTFREWAEERKKLTPDQIEDIEAYTQGLERVPAAEEGEEEVERLTPKIESEERAAMEAAYKPLSPPAPELIFKRYDSPKWWRKGGVAAIDLTAPGSQVIIKPYSKGIIFIATIVLTVIDATAITLKFGNGGESGPIYLGDTDQPKGMVIAMGNSPAPCGSGGFSISATDINSTNPAIGGFVTYFLEEQ
jgi:hypothetical protein